MSQLALWMKLPSINVRSKGPIIKKKLSIKKLLMRQISLYKRFSKGCMMLLRQSDNFHKIYKIKYILSLKITNNINKNLIRKRIKKGSNK